jgi:uncharacterized membrane protein
MSAWEIARRSGWSTRAVIAAAALAVLLVAAVPAALFAGIILMLFGHVVGGLALFGGSILAAGAGVLTAVTTGVWRVRKELTRLTRPSASATPVVQLHQGDYHYS